MQRTLLDLALDLLGSRGAATGPTARSTGARRSGRSTSTSARSTDQASPSRWTRIALVEPAVDGGLPATIVT